MKEVFENLAEQAMVHVPGQTGLHTRAFSLEKFAELIVRECAQVAVFKDNGTVSTAEVAGYIAAGRSTAARLIKEHFGVEE